MTYRKVDDVSAIPPESERRAFSIRNLKVKQNIHYWRKHIYTATWTHMAAVRVGM